MKSLFVESISRDAGQVLRRSKNKIDVMVPRLSIDQIRLKAAALRMQLCFLDNTPGYSTRKHFACILALLIDRDAYCKAGAARQEAFRQLGVVAASADKLVNIL